MNAAVLSAPPPFTVDTLASRWGCSPGALATTRYGREQENGQ